MSKKFDRYSEKTKLTRCMRCGQMVRYSYAVGKKGLSYKIFNEDNSVHQCVNSK